MFRRDPVFSGLIVCLLLVLAWVCTGISVEMANKERILRSHPPGSRILATISSAPLAAWRTQAWCVVRLPDGSLTTTTSDGIER